ncbi:MAG: ABC transporter ATP-binding protein/permease [Oscillospiraceae bacterium]|jgi:ATP-binding cassette subfamily B protein|nr:ABC transporter ATP-binding protein/permease [Oscillospiraceae bacterium]
MKRGMYKKGTAKRLLKTLFQFHPVALPLITLCIVFTAAVSSMPSIFMQNIIAVLEQNQGGDWAHVGSQILRLVSILAVLYMVSLASSLVYNRAMAVITQASLKKMREKLFNKMEGLPVRYFDTHPHGDIMSHYTNDIDTLRQFISQSMPQLLISAITILTLFSIMIYYSVWMAGVVLGGVAFMLLVIRKVGGNSAKYFIRQQRSLGKAEGYIEEMMNGQKVIKVFCHEEETKAGFDAVNDDLFHNSEQANTFANILAPILMNIGNLIYVAVAMAGGIFLLTKAHNLSISGLVFSISVVVPFLNITRQFCGNINQVSQQLNAVIMGLAGADRIFAVLDEASEEDAGHIMLVNSKEENGALVECAERTELWAWKEPLPDGTARYTRLAGDVRLREVNFHYAEDKSVLHHITLFAEPGQKVAFVGATGAGKTTITNLLNRFYDIADGEISYDGININKIKKSDLRRAIGLVLQDTNLFTGTVIDNIRYGRLDATDAECETAAKLAGAHDFITRLPEGYRTLLLSNGSNLSQGQRQLIAIARAAVADPPVMILDEATSSIDTHTEAIVQRGMDDLMKGRTVFVIAHRLSTVQNSDVIMVLERGEIIERGSHAHLIEEKGKYYQLYTGAFELE